MPAWHFSLTVFVYVTLLQGESESLNCYQCTNEKTNIHCVDDYNVQRCDRGMDTCQTITSYSDVSERLSILKSCTTNVSCHLQKQEYYRSCNLVSPGWVCVYCCHHDKCNIHAASGTISSLRTKSLLRQILDYIFLYLIISVNKYISVLML
ncbi:prostate stem cell antigen-like [Saccostrea echinata]|uniref:prostate stem cell antigen-like n=1 Tax=Saccostrea echinata TaxID=191078 RepID=UPI002A83613E|nr:prostate stem cell antigen-like [Saccostrea echinata]